ncbi:ATP-binding protein [Actinacidiphila acididurans]|uniref:ATP-binding protein n=1 Tax=Actinacidiphila acididurans TaxID=2784346 RepID=A0ABS2TK82_9ACTN|nr:ATP-binding protein [Actinacidiphila acididurans]MBM9503758.1 ATP-binding protein [Actinacidiphila acididurans]
MSGRGGSEQPRPAEPAPGAAPVLAADVDDGAVAGVADVTDAPAVTDVTDVADHATDTDDIDAAEDPAPAAPDLPGDPSVAEVLLPTSDRRSAAKARRMSLSVLRRWGLLQFADPVELLVSELVGNAVRHTGAHTMGLRMHRRRGWIRVEVRDPSRALPCLLPVRELDISGRGLFLVDTLADRWGVDLQARGKVTWFELRVAPER